MGGGGGGVNYIVKTWCSFAIKVKVHPFDSGSLPFTKRTLVHRLVFVWVRVRDRPRRVAEKGDTGQETQPVTGREREPRGGDKGGV